MSRLFSLIAISFLLLQLTHSSMTPVHLRKRVVNGEVDPEKKAWMVSIQSSSGSHFCGGSLIRHNIVLTAAHCFIGMSEDGISGLIVSANRHDLTKSTKEENGVDMYVVEIARHVDFNEDTLENDIALLQVEPMKDYVQNMKYLRTISIDTSNAGLNNMEPDVASMVRRMRIRRRSAPTLHQVIDASPLFASSSISKLIDASILHHSLATNTTEAGKPSAVKSRSLTQATIEAGIKNSGLPLTGNLTADAIKADTLQGVDLSSTINNDLYASGWGTTSDGGSKASPILLRLPMKIAKLSRCSESDLFSDRIAPKSVVCAMGADFDSDTCQGDSGGPLYTSVKGKPETLVGIVSFGIGCNSKNGTLINPGVYTRSTYYQRFIMNYIRHVETGDSLPQPKQRGLLEFVPFSYQE